MERENANFSKVIDELRDHFGPKIVPVQLPIGNGEAFSGIVDLVKMKAFIKDGDQLKEGEIPADMMMKLNRLGKKWSRRAAVADDELMLKFLEGED